MTMITITAEEFASLKWAADRVEETKDVEYAHEMLFDCDGRELGFASYHSYRGAEYVRHSEPLSPPSYDEDGNEIEVA